MSEPFLAALSVDELVLVREAGFRPLGLVVGLSVFREGEATAPNAAGEFADVTQSVYLARQRALSRLEAEAEGLGADGVIGVGIAIERISGGPMARVSALGTAVKAFAPPVGSLTETWHTPRGTPFTCTVSGQGFWSLIGSGWVPLGVVMGLTDYQAPRVQGPRPEAGEEATEVTAALYQARDRTTSRLRAEAEELGADGVVDLTLTGFPPPETHGPTRMLALGTAVRAAGPSARTLPSPAPVVTLDA